MTPASTAVSSPQAHIAARRDAGLALYVVVHTKIMETLA